MSAAHVKFLTLDHQPCAADQQPDRFAFRCVCRNRGRDPRLEMVMCEGLLIANSSHGIKRDGQGKNGGRPQWDWNGDREAPTFRPSINCESHCGWHGYLENGRCVDVHLKDEPE